MSIRWCKKSGSRSFSALYFNSYSVTTSSRSSRFNRELVPCYTVKFEIEFSIRTTMVKKIRQKKLQSYKYTRILSCLDTTKNMRRKLTPDCVA